MGSFQDLVVWQKAMGLVREVYKLTEILPREEKYGIVSQLRRSAVSVPSNIAEGHARTTKRDFSRFLSIALGSLREVQTLLLLCDDLGLAKPSAQLTQCEDIAKMLHGLMKSLEGKN